LYTFNVPFSSLVEGNYQKIDLPTPVAVTDFFYVGVTMNTTQGDTLVLGAAPYRGANDFSNTSFALVNSVWTPVTSAFTGSSATSLAIRATLAFIPKAKFDSDVVQTCVGKTINYDATQTTNANNIEWTFEGGNPTTSTATKPVVTYNTQGPKTVRLVAFGGCANSDTLIKTINIAPPPSLEIEVIDEVCMGKNGEAKALPAGGSGSYTFNWNTTPAQTSSIATGLSAGSYLYLYHDRFEVRYRYKIS
jgi:PKD repeat protein